MKIVYIEWVDAMTINEGWQPEEELKKWAESNDWKVNQIGFLIEETPEYLLVAGLKNPERRSFSEDRYSSVTKIPKGWIKRLEEIKIPPKKVKKKVKRKGKKND